MEFLIDVHLPITLSKFLAKQGNCESIHVNRILDKWFTSDRDICKYADENNLVVVTKDEDFKSSHFINKTPKKVIRVTSGNISNFELILLFEKYLPAILSLSAKSKLYVEISRNQIIVID